MTPEQKAQRLELRALEAEAHASRAANQALRSDPGSKAFARYETHRRRWLADAALLRESAAMWRERGAVQWHIKDGDIIQTAALYQGRFLVATGKEGHTACWTASKKHDERSCEIFDTAESLPAAQAAAVAWVDAQERKP